jgi:uncharacterized protein DUF4440
MLKTILFLLAMTVPAILPADLAKDESQVWNLEKAYWEYVRANDLAKYRELWHKDSIAWPPGSSTPLRKSQVTDWLTENISKGIKLESFSIEQIASKITGEVAVMHYRLKMVWAGPKTSDHQTELLRVYHTWIRTGDTFQIIGGMGAPVNAEGK